MTNTLAKLLLPGQRFRPLSTQPPGTYPTSPHNISSRFQRTKYTVTVKLRKSNGLFFFLFFFLQYNKVLVPWHRSNEYLSGNCVHRTGITTIVRLCHDLEMYKLAQLNLDNFFAKKTQIAALASNLIKQCDDMIFSHLHRHKLSAICSMAANTYPSALLIPTVLLDHHI